MCFLPALARKRELNGLRLAFGLLLVAIAWAGLSFFAVYEIMLGKTFELIGDWYVFFAPALCASHVLGAWLVQSRPEGPLLRRNE